MIYGKLDMAMTSDVDGSKTNLSYSHKVGGEFESGLLPLKCGTKPPPMNKSANGRDRTWPSVSPRDPAISVVRMEGILVDRSISRSLRTNAQESMLGCPVLRQLLSLHSFYYLGNLDSCAR
jgi:hypothetical protein